MANPTSKTHPQPNAFVVCYRKDDDWPIVLMYVSGGTWMKQDGADVPESEIQEYYRCPIKEPAPRKGVGI